ncbi:MAG: hypothetical protein HYY50_05820 [Candidatus Kerfeldbacteria bacterium]|nr:hypothetical protein [Candidatus Kerfeldbacteria bacterium]
MHWLNRFLGRKLWVGVVVIPLLGPVAVTVHTWTAVLSGAAVTISLTASRCGNNEPRDQRPVKNIDGELPPDKEP